MAGDVMAPKDASVVIPAYVPSAGRRDPADALQVRVSGWNIVLDYPGAQDRKRQSERERELLALTMEEEATAASGSWRG